MCARSLPLLLVAGLLTGCITTNAVYMDRPSEDMLAEINALGEGRTARLTLFGQPSITVNNIYVRTDTTAWESTRTGRRLVALTAEVEEIRFAQKLIAEGAVVGAGLGLFAGMILGRDCPSDDPECISRGDLTPMAGLVGGAFGGILSSRGQVRYRFVAATGQPLQIMREP